MVRGYENLIKMLYEAKMMSKVAISGRRCGEKRRSKGWFGFACVRSAFRGGGIPRIAVDSLSSLPTKCPSSFTGKSCWKRLEIVPNAVIGTVRAGFRRCVCRKVELCVDQLRTIHRPLLKIRVKRPNSKRRLPTIAGPAQRLLLRFGLEEVEK